MAEEQNHNVINMDDMSSDGYAIVAPRRKTRDDDNALIVNETANDQQRLHNNTKMETMTRHQTKETSNTTKTEKPTAKER